MPVLVPTSEICTEAGQVASAVVDLLNDSTLTLPSPAARHYLPAVELTTALESKVLVAATSRSLQRQTRGGGKQHVVGTQPDASDHLRRVMVEVGVSKKFGEYSDNRIADPIVFLAESIANLLASVYIDVSEDLRIYAIDDGVVPAVEHQPLYDPAVWKENNQVTCIVTVNYRLVDL